MGLIKAFMRKVALASAVLVGKNVFDKIVGKEEAKPAEPGRKTAAASKAPAKPRSKPASAKSGTKARPAAKTKNAAQAKPKTAAKPKTPAKPRTAAKSNAAKPETTEVKPDGQSAGPGAGTSGS